MWKGICKNSFFKNIFFRPAVRPGARSSSMGRCCFKYGFLTSNLSILFSQKGVDAPYVLPPVNVFLFVKIAAVISPAVSPQRGLNCYLGSRAFLAFSVLKNTRTNKFASLDSPEVFCSPCFPCLAVTCSAKQFSRWLKQRQLSLLGHD